MINESIILRRFGAAFCIACVLDCGAIAATPTLEPVPVPDITSFTSRSDYTMYVDGHPFRPRNANRSWSLTKLDGQTLRFELRSGDYWATDKAIRPANTPERSLLDGSDHLFQPGTRIQASYKIKVEPGPRSTATWFVIAQFHNADSYLGASTSPPFEIDLCADGGSVKGGGDHMTISVGWLTANPSSLNPPLYSTTAGRTGISYDYVYRDPQPIVRGREYQMVIQALFHATNGHACVWRDGVQIVNYRGPLGFGCPVYWGYGLYRAPTTNDTQRVQYKDFVISP